MRYQSFKQWMGEVNSFIHISSKGGPSSANELLDYGYEADYKAGVLPSEAAADALANHRLAIAGGERFGRPQDPKRPKWAQAA